MKTNKNITNFNTSLVELNRAYKDGYITKSEYDEQNEILFLILN